MLTYFTRILTEQGLTLLFLIPLVPFYLLSSSLTFGVNLEGIVALKRRSMLLRGLTAKNAGF